jgi:hypothetical protein
LYKKYSEHTLIQKHNKLSSQSTNYNSSDILIEKQKSDSSFTQLKTTQRENNHSKSSSLILKTLLTTDKNSRHRANSFYIVRHLLSVKKKQHTINKDESNSLSRKGIKDIYFCLNDFFVLILMHRFFKFKIKKKI